MPNILLTTGCNLSCEYCFAKEKMAGKRQDMSFEDVKKVFTFLKKSNSQLFRVMGGEPTLHKHFPEIMELALWEGFRVNVMSNADWKEEYNKLFNKIAPSRVQFLLNIDHPSNYTANEWAKINHNIASIAGQQNITLSFNLFEKKPKFDYIKNLCLTYGIDKVRMSLSFPVLGANNTFLEIEEYEELSDFIVDTVRKAEANRISIRFDNAVPFCMFSNEQLGELLIKRVIDLERNAKCEPIIDIGPDLKIWTCFCLSKRYSRHLDDFENLAQAKAYYQKVLDLYQGKVFPMEKCYQCAYNELWGCQGGCLTYALQRKGKRYQEQPVYIDSQPVAGTSQLLNDQRHQ